jgi:hypothetical protein
MWFVSLLWAYPKRYSDQSLGLRGWAAAQGRPLPPPAVKGLQSTLYGQSPETHERLQSNVKLTFETTLRYPH